MYTSINFRHSLVLSFKKFRLNSAECLSVFHRLAARLKIEPYLFDLSLLAWTLVGINKRKSPCKDQYKLANYYQMISVDGLSILPGAPKELKIIIFTVRSSMISLDTFKCSCVCSVFKMWGLQLEDQ